MATDTLQPETEAEVWLQILHPDGALTPNAARAILGLSIPPAELQRLRGLSAKAQTGTLTAEAELLAPAFSKHPGQLTPADLCNLPNYTAYARILMIDGHPSRPFSLRTLPPPRPASADLGRAEIVRRTSQHRHARPAAAAPHHVELQTV